MATEFSGPRHPFPPGERVRIYGTLPYSGAECVEGIATIRGNADLDHHYFVEFDTKPGTLVERSVLPGDFVKLGEVLPSLDINKNPEIVLSVARFLWSEIPSWYGAEIIDRLCAEELIETRQEAFDNGHGDIDSKIEWRLTRKGLERLAEIRGREESHG